MFSTVRARALGVAIVVAAWSSGSGCRRSLPDAPVVAPTLSDLQVLKDGRHLFTYVEPAGTFATTDKPEIIPEQSRKMVRVIDPGQTKTKELTDVYTTNVMDLLKSGKATARPLPREAFETAAIAQLPPGESSPFAPGRRTSWCGACRAARQYFAEHKIPFADKDVEQDASAARELAEKAAKMGIPTDRVPILEVRGRLLLGFDRARVEALLGERT